MKGISMSMVFRSARLACLIAIAGVLSAQTSVTGSIKYPDGIGVTGKLSIQLNRTTVTNACTAPVQVVTFYPITVSVTNGTVGTLALYASPCNVPRITVPTVKPSAAAGGGATATIVSSNDLQGTVTLVTGDTPAPSIGTVAIVTFGQKYQGTLSPKCITTLNGVQYGIGYESTPQTIKFNVATALATSSSFTIGYYCGFSPYSVTLQDSNKVVLYTGQWVVPNQGSANVSALDLR